MPLQPEWSHRPHYDYATLVKTALKGRLPRVYILSFLLLHASLSVAISPLRSPLLLFSPTLFIPSAFVWSLTALPLLVAAKWSISRSAPPATRPASTLAPRGSPLTQVAAHLGASQVWSAATLSAACAVLFALAYTLLLPDQAASTQQWGLRVTVSTRSGHTTTRPNERVFFLVGACGAAAFVRGLTKSLREGRRPGEPSALAAFTAASIYQTPGQRIIGAVGLRARQGIVGGALSMAVLFVLYALVRRKMWETVLVIIGPRSPLRSVLIPTFHDKPISLELFWRALLLGAASAFTSETVEELWDTYASQPVQLSHFAKSPTRTLADGLELHRSSPSTQAKSALLGAVPAKQDGPTTRRYCANFAFAELALLASSSKERRAEIFKDIGPVDSAVTLGGRKVEGAWAKIRNECLDVLREEQQAVKEARETLNPPKVAKGAAARPAPSTPSSAQRPRSTMSPGRNALVQDKAVVKTPQQTVWDKLAAEAQRDGTPSKAAAPQEAIVTLQKRLANAGALGWAMDMAGRLLGGRVVPLKPSEASSSTAVAKSQPSTAPAPAPTSAPAPASLASSPLLTVLSLAVDGTSQLTAWLPADVQHVLTHSFAAPLSSPRRTSPSLVLYPLGSAMSIWTVQALSALLSASLVEDEYGVVQPDLATVVRALLALLREIVALGSEGTDAARQADVELALRAGGSNAQSRTHRVAEHFEQTWDAKLRPLELTIRSGVNLVLNTFEGYDIGLDAVEREEAERARRLP